MKNDDPRALDLRLKKIDKLA